MNSSAVRDDVRTVPNVRAIRYAAGTLAFVVAVLHLFHPQYGFTRLVQYVQVGTLFDPRPLVFTLSGLAIVAGVLLVFNGVTKRPVYLAGIALMVTYLVGYGAWHTVLEHGGFWPYIEPYGHHEMGTIAVIVDHLRHDWLALASKLAELALLALLVVLYRFDRE